MKTPEEFFAENSTWQPSDKWDKKAQRFDYYDVTDFAQRYAEHVLKEAAEKVTKLRFDNDEKAGEFAIPCWVTDCCGIGPMTDKENYCPNCGRKIIKDTNK